MFNKRIETRNWGEKAEVEFTFHMLYKLELVYGKWKVIKMRKDHPKHKEMDLQHLEKQFNFGC
ncbi:hypothetical protein OAV92_01435 [Crocinitomicaceae bacterium]|nr:hypothetical protein [Crocinitomicaceae bacterium]